MLPQIFKGRSVKGRDSSQCVDLSEVGAETLLMTLKKPDLVGMLTVILQTTDVVFEALYLR